MNPGTQLGGSRVRDTPTCDPIHGSRGQIHSLGQRAVDNAVDSAVDKTVNNVMVSLAISAHDGPEVAAAPVFP